MTRLCGTYQVAKTGLPGAEAEIGFLEVQEVVFVQAADDREHLGADHHRGATNPVGGPGDFGHIPCDHPGAQDPRHDPGAHSLIQLAQKRGEAKRDRPVGAVRILEAAAGYADPGMRLEEAYQCMNGTRTNLRVRV